MKLKIKLEITKELTDLEINEIEETLLSFPYIKSITLEDKRE